MNVDTGQFMAITEQLASLAVKVERLERRDQAREDVAALIAGGTPGRHTRSRHLHSVRTGPGR